MGNVVFFHQFFKIVSFLCYKVSVAVRGRQPDDVTADYGVNHMEFHGAVFAEIGDVWLVPYQNIPLFHDLSFCRGWFVGGKLTGVFIEMVQTGVCTFVDETCDRRKNLAFPGG